MKRLSGAATPNTVAKLKLNAIKDEINGLTETILTVIESKTPKKDLQEFKIYIAKLVSEEKGIEILWQVINDLITKQNKELEELNQQLHHTESELESAGVRLTETQFESRRAIPETYYGKKQLAGIT